MDLHSQNQFHQALSGLTPTPAAQQLFIPIYALPNQPMYPFSQSPEDFYHPPMLSSDIAASTRPIIFQTNPFYSNFSFPPPHFSTHNNTGHPVETRFPMQNSNGGELVLYDLWHPMSISPPGLQIEQLHPSAQFQKQDQQPGSSSYHAHIIPSNHQQKADEHQQTEATIFQNQRDPQTYFSNTSLPVEQFKPKWVPDLSPFNNVHYHQSAGLKQQQYLNGGFSQTNKSELQPNLTSKPQHTFVPLHSLCKPPPLSSNIVPVEMSEHTKDLSTEKLKSSDRTPSLFNNTEQLEHNKKNVTLPNSSKSYDRQQKGKGSYRTNWNDQTKKQQSQIQKQQSQIQKNQVFKITKESTVISEQNSCTLAENSFYLKQNSFHPEQNSFHPEQNSCPPEQNSFHPEQISFHPEQTSFHPEQNSFQPEQNTFQPEQDIFHTEHNSFYPEQNIFQPKLKTFQPEDNGYNSDKNIRKENDDFERVQPIPTLNNVDALDSYVILNEKNCITSDHLTISNQILNQEQICKSKGVVQATANAESNTKVEEYVIHEKLNRTQKENHRNEIVSCHEPASDTQEIDITIKENGTQQEDNSTEQETNLARSDCSISQESEHEEVVKVTEQKKDVLCQQQNITTGSRKQTRVDTKEKYQSKKYSNNQQWQRPSTAQLFYSYKPNDYGYYNNQSIPQTPYNSNEQIVRRHTQAYRKIHGPSFFREPVNNVHINSYTNVSHFTSRIQERADVSDYCDEFNQTRKSLEKLSIDNNYNGYNILRGSSRYFRNRQFGRSPWGHNNFL